MPVLLDESTVRANFTMKQCIAAVEQAHAAAGRGHMWVLPRRVIAAGEGARLHALSAASDELGYLFSLNYSGTPTGANKNTTTVNRRHKVYTLFNAKTGACEAVLGGRYLSWLTTGAVGAVAIKHLAAVDATSIALIGSGQQARAALLGALEVRELSDIRVWSRTAESAQKLVQEFSHLAGIRYVPTAEDAVRGAAIVVTVTTSGEPVVKGEWLDEGSHVNSIGAHYPTRRELDTAAIVESTVFVDSRATASVEKGELLIPHSEGVFPLDRVRAEVGEVIAATTPWTRTPGERTVFASCGSAIEAFGAAIGVYEAVSGADAAFVSFD